MVFVFFSLLIIGDNIARARTIPFWAYLYLGFFGVALLLTLVAFSPNVLEKQVKVIGFDLGMQNVLLSIKRSDYRAQLIEENPMTVELVSWIMRSDD
jgi:hypothetical protein